MAQHALCCVKARAGLDLRGPVLVILRPKRRSGRTQQDPARRRHQKLASHGVTSPSRSPEQNLRVGILWPGA
jgi:hypothetical protein